MKKNILIVTAVSVFFLFGITLHLFAQKTPLQAGDFGPNFDIVANLANLQQQLSSLVSAVAAGDRQINNKLDQILANQDKIFNELEIVKIRASRSR
jgi:hypothetical protein